VLLLCAGCGNDELDPARKFDRFPLYWVGPRFEKWDLNTVDGLDYPTQIVSFIYGECTPQGEDEPSCTLPFEIQVSPDCVGPINWNGRRIRGAPVGTIDSAPVLFTRGVQVKVYRGEGSDPDLPLRVLRALRSINDVPPVIDSHGPIPPPGTRSRCP
jgi:hypothetical protein